jgi:ribosome-binding protein aMBF1 (putative translation factor)
MSASIDAIVSQVLESAKTGGVTKAEIAQRVVYEACMSVSIDDLVEQVVDGWKASGLTKNELAQRAELHPNTLRRLGHAGFNPNLATLRALQKALPASAASGTLPIPGNTLV